MGEGQVIQGITGGILAIVGILLAIISSGIWVRRVKIRIGFLGIGLALSGVGLFILITSFPQYAIGFSVLATLALAFAAFLTIKEADAREQRHRNNELLKERRDRDAALLNEIIDWAVEVVKIGVPPIGGAGLVVLPDEATRWRILDILGILRNNFRAMIAKSLYVSSIGLSFGEKLQCRIDALERDLRKQDDILLKCLEIIVNRKISEYNDAWKELIDNWDTLGDSAANVVDEAVIEKLNILNI